MAILDISAENVGAYISLNGRIIGTDEYYDMQKSGSNSERTETPRVAYEIIRVIHGKPALFMDHFTRLEISLVKLDAEESVDQDTLRRDIDALLAANGVSDCNIKIWSQVIPADASKGRPGTVSRVLNINKSFYPPASYYEKGVAVSVFNYTRQNPTAKHVIAGYKERVAELMEKSGSFVLLLCDAQGRLTEGSRSNLFFSYAGKLCTAPADMILMGTVRKYVFLAARAADINIEETPLCLEELHAGRADGAFLTGTSIGVLPVASVDGINLNSVRDPLISRIRSEYERICVEHS